MHDERLFENTTRIAAINALQAYSVYLLYWYKVQILTLPTAHACCHHQRHQRAQRIAATGQRLSLLALLVQNYKY
jgi:hypothetical protein